MGHTMPHWAAYRQPYAGPLGGRLTVDRGPGVLGLALERMGVIFRLHSCNV